MRNGGRDPDRGWLRMKDPGVIIPVLLVGGSIVLSTVLTALNSVVYIDPALVFVLMWFAILAAWSVLNRWEGDSSCDGFSPNRASSHRIRRNSREGIGSNRRCGAS